MKIKKTKRDGPEAKIQEAIIKKLTLLGWFCKTLHGNIFQHGLPDIFVCHKSYGWRFIEVKNPAGYSFTPSQRECFHRLSAEGVGIWILTSPDDSEIQKLFKPPNWYWYLEIMRH